MPQPDPWVKPLRNLLSGCLLVFISILFSNQTFAEFAPAPQVTSTGLMYTVEGGTVTINGNFFTGATSVLIGGNGDTPAASFTVVSDNQIQAVIARGTRSGFVKIITTSGSSATGSLIISIKLIARIESFTPTSGAAGTEVTIKGFNFTGTTAVSFGGTAAASYTLINDSVIRAVVGSGSTGQVRVVNSDGTGFFGTFTYAPATPVPNITSFTPANGTTGSMISIKGNYLSGASAVAIGGVDASSFTVLTDSTINAVVAAGAGSGAVAVTTPGGTYSTNGFTYVTPDLKPHISSFTPGSASPRTTITIKGYNFTGATQVSFGGTPASSFSVVSDSTITALVFSGSTGWVKITTPGGADSLGGFTYIPAAPEVTTTGILYTVVGDTITVNGNFFTGATSVLIGGNGDTPAASFTVVSDNQIRVVIARGTQSGFIKIITPSGSSATGSLIISIKLIARIESFTPTSGAAGTEVTIKGFNFTGTSAVSFGGTAAASYTFVSDTILRAVVGSGSTGQVRIDNSDGWGYLGTFTYTASKPVPNITSFTPTSGTTGTTITIKGFYFTGATAVTIGGVAASSFTVLYDSIINAVVATGAGSGAVAVTTPGGTHSASGFTYVAPDLKPHISSFTPGSASPRITVTIKGYNFTGATQVSFGGTPASSFSVVSDSTITALVFSGSTGWVKVITLGGADSLNYFTYIPAPPEVTTTGILYTVAGGTVTINGNFFTGATSVSIGGNGDTPAASFTVVSDNQIQAVIARGTQSGFIKIITPAGSSATGSLIISVKHIAHIDSFTPTSGAAGTEVTIKGFNFTGTSAVSFGGTAAASYTLVSDTILRAVVGSGSTGQVRVDNSDGWGYLGTFTYVVAAAVPNITSFTPVNGTTGTVVTIKGNYFTGASAVTIGGVATSSFTVLSDSIMHAVIAAGANSGAVGVITGGGTASLNGFTYVIPDLKPQISSFTPMSGGSGTLVTIKGSNFGNVTAVSFGSTAAISFTVSDSIITAEIGFGGTGVVKVTTSNGSDTLGMFTYTSAKILAAPNPAIGSILIAHPVSSKNAVIKLTNSMGNIVQNVKVIQGNSQTKLDLTGVAPGIYIIWWGDGASAFSKTVLIK
ncbi:IPT/TIG domain-containing protein [Flavitalea sp.]|nr:IPT/TIG domain-containing protein [Flavitalea sp.]